MPSSTGDHLSSLTRKNSTANPEVSSQLTLRVETSFDALEDLRAQWDETVCLLGGTIYMTYDWCRIWWDFYGEGRQLRLFSFHLGDEIVGLIPIYLDSLGIGPVCLRLARIVGANIPPKVFDPPVHPEWAVGCFEQLVRHLLTEDRCDLITLGPVSSQYAPWAKFPEACLRFTSHARIVPGDGPVHTVFWPPARLEDYFQSLGRNEQKNRRRYYELGNLRKQFAVRIEAVSAPNADLVSEFDRFAVQHARQWETEGRAGHFGSWPAALAYNRALVDAHGRLGRLRFIRICANDQVVANHYTFSFAGRWFCELPSREVGNAWDRYSLGPAGIVAMVGEAIKEGVHRMEGGLGHYEYKLRLKAAEYPTRVFRVVARHPSSRIRKLIFDGIRLLLHYGYYKIWYRRITPLLPAGFRLPLTRLWLRFDF